MSIRIFKNLLLTIFLLCGVLFLGGCSDLKVQTVDEETEANEIINVLREHRLTAYKEEGGEGENKVFNIMVEGGDLEYGAAIQLMDDHCLPQSLPPKVESSGIVSSVEVEKEKAIRRTKIDIAKLLRQIPGTTCVDITIVPPEDRSIALTTYKSSATVIIKHKTEKYDLNVRQLADAISGAVPGLTPDNVKVILTRQPLRPVPDFSSGRNLRRILYVGGIGFITILLFVGLAIYLRKRKEATEKDVDELENGESEALNEGKSANNTGLLEENSVEADLEANPENSD